MNKRSFAAVLLVGLVVTLAMFFLPANKDVVQAEDSITNGELKGWAWSSNIGWISFNSKNAGAEGGSEYSVKLDPTDKTLSGYAWSSNLGWIKFDSSLSGPAGMGDNYGVRLEADNALRGWARACSVFASNCGGELKPDYQRGGWDGWVKMIDAKYDIDRSEFKDFAWGGLNFGWVGFGLGLDRDDWEVIIDNPGTSRTVMCDVSTAGPVPTGTPVTWYVSQLLGFSSSAKDLSYNWVGSDPAGPRGTGGWSDAEGRSQKVVTYDTPGQKIGSVTVSETGGSAADDSCGNGVKICVPQDGSVPGVDSDDCCPGLTPVAQEDGTYVCGVPETECSITLAGGNTIRLSINEQTPTYNNGSTIYYRSPQTQSQGVKLAGSCSENLAVTGLPSSDVILVCARAGISPLVWGPCEGLSSGNYYVGVALLKTLADAGYDGFSGPVSLGVSGNSVSTTVIITSTQGS